MTVVPKPEHYREAARLVRAGWSTHDYATDRDGKAVKPMARGERFCASGAVCVAAGAAAHPHGFGPDDDDEATLLGPLVASLVRAGALAEEGDRCDGFAAVAWWNQHASGAEDVAAALERCAGELERCEIGVGADP